MLSLAFEGDMGWESSLVKQGLRNSEIMEPLCPVVRGEVGQNYL